MARAPSPISCTKVSMELLVAPSALATDSVEGHRSRPSAVIRLDLLKVVGSRPERLASPEGDSPARSASRSSAVQICSWVSILCAFGCLAIGRLGSKARNYYLSKPAFTILRKSPNATLEVRRLRRYGRCEVRKLREIPRDSTTSRTPGTCAGSTKFVPLRPGARPSGKACTAAAPTTSATGLFIFRHPHSWRGPPKSTYSV